MKKNILIFVGLAVAGVYIYNRIKPTFSASTTVKPNETPTNTNTSACPVGQVACSDGKNCYDPSINYLVDPCSNAY
jgi:hypothetical protein